VDSLQRSVLRLCQIQKLHFNIKTFLSFNFFEVSNLNCLYVKKYHINTQAPEANYSRLIWMLIEKDDLFKKYLDLKSWFE